MKDKFYNMRDEPSTQGLIDMINYMGDTSNMDMIEIGSYIGQSTLIFSDRFKSITSVDPFLNDYDPKDDACKYADFDLVYKEFIKNTKDKPNITHFRLISDTFSTSNDISVDFVYIDGLHTEEQVKKDITNYMKFIRPNGFIGGHDYHPAWSGVIKAIHNTIGQPDKVFQDGSWIKKL